MKLLASLDHHGNCSLAAFNPDGSRILTGGASWGKHARILVWDAATYRMIHKFDCNSQHLGNAEFSPDGQRIFILEREQEQRTITVLNSSDGAPVRRWTAGCSQLRWNVDSDRLGCAIKAFAGLLATSTGQFDSLVTNEGDILDICFSSDGSTLVTGSMDRTAVVIECLSRQRVIQPITHPAAVEFVQLNPTGNRLLTIAQDQIVRNWAIVGKKAELVWENNCPFPINSATFDQAAERVLLCSSSGVDASSGQGAAVMLDASSGATLAYRLFGGRVGRARRSSFNADCGRVLITADGTTELLNATDMKFMGALQGEAAGFNHDSSQILTHTNPFSSNGRADVWDSDPALS